MNAPLIIQIASLLPGEIVVDSFAGGGGASEGIRMALGRDPDIAINHDALALAMHRVNHPGTHHMVEDVWKVDARRMCGGQAIGLLWLSPDCKHFSKAKGGKPREKAIRGLAWVGLRWVKSLPRRQRPRLLFLENVEEFQDWGPLLDDGRPCPVQKGSTFKSYIEGFRSLGYAAEWRQLRACDYGDPTIRKRLFVIMRRDGLPIVWPSRTHGNPKDPKDAALIAAGTLEPWRTAAEFIDFSLPCPSIFETSAQIKAALGLRAQRPLRQNTMSRVAKGTMRYVVNAVRPFIIKINHTGRDEPPILVNVANSQTTGRGPNTWPLAEPARTMTSNGGHAVVAPILVGCGGRAGQSEPRPANEPVLTQTAKADACVITPFLVPRYAEEPGHEPRVRPVDEPAATIVAGDNVPGSLAAVHLSRQFGQSIGAPVDAPAPTVTCGGAGKSAVVAVFLAQHNTDMVGHVIDEPLSTIVGKGCTQGLVQASFLSHAYTSNSAGGSGEIDRPLKTTLAGGQHAALVAAFLAKYYGSGEPVQAADDPLHTVTTKPRHGLVTVMLSGEPYVITDIGMRMLTPRERFSAQGFRRDYIIDYGALADGTRVSFTLEQQGRMCGNSVCPGMARALVAANAHGIQKRRRPPRVRAAPLLEAARQLDIFPQAANQEPTSSAPTRSLASTAPMSMSPTPSTCMEGGSAAPNPVEPHSPRQASMRQERA